VEDVMIEMNDAMILRIRSLVVAMVNAFDIPAQRELIAQAATIHSPTGIPTMLEFQVDRSLEPAQGSPNPLDVTAEVKTAEGKISECSCSGSMRRATSTRSNFRG
jgi:hypothetical protein